MGFFSGFSRRPDVDSEGLQKRDSSDVFRSPKVPIYTLASIHLQRHHLAAGGQPSGRRVRGMQFWFKPDGSARSSTAGDPAGIDVEDLAGRADVGECRGIGAGHPDLRAELCQLIEQRLAPGGIEMRHHLVEQQ